MQDFLINMGLSVLIELFEFTIPRDGTTANKWKKAFLKLFNLIAAAYGSDPDFKKAAQGIAQ